MFILLVKMKLIDIFTPTTNRVTKQDGGTWRKKRLKRLGVTPRQLLIMTPEELKKLLSITPKVKFYKKR